MEERVFLHLRLVKRVPLKKVLQFLMPLEPIYNKNFCFDEQKSLLWTLL